MNVVTSLLGLVIVSHLSPKGSERFKRGGEPPLRQNFPRKKIFFARMSYVLFDYFESGS
jgi:hypothetical protein